MLFIRGGAVGDFLLTLPAMQLVRDELPEVEIEILGYDSISQVATASGIAAATRSIEYGPLAQFFVPGCELDPELEDYFASFSVVVSYLFDPDGHFHENLRRAGVDTLVEASHRVDDTSEDAQSAAHQLAAPLESLALYLDRPFVDLRFRSTSSPVHTPAAAATIALHPGSGSARKNWSPQAWIEVARQLDRNRNLGGIRFLVVSGEAEDRSIDAFLTELGKTGVEYESARHLPLAELGQRLSHCDLFLGHDSGISHLAAASGAPCVLLFGPTRAQVWAPQNPAVQIIEAEKGDLKSIEVERVVKVARSMLRKK